LKAISRELDALFDRVIEEHKTQNSDDDQPNKLDFVEILLRLQKNSMLDVELTKDNLKAIIMVSLSLYNTSSTHAHTHTHKLMSKVLCFHNFRICLWEELKQLQQLWNG
jgi:hypothetical protein